MRLLRKAWPCRPRVLQPGLPVTSGTLHAGGGGGLAALGAGGVTACRRRVVVLMTPFSPFGSGEAATRGGVLAKLQTHWAKNAENRSF